LLKGLKFTFTKEPERLEQYDQLILTSRYYQNKFGKRFNRGNNLDVILQEIIKIKSEYNCKVVYYDLAASPATREIRLLPELDLLLKRQVFQNRSVYKGSMIGVGSIGPGMKEQRDGLLIFLVLMT